MLFGRLQPVLTIVNITDSICIPPSSPTSSLFDLVYYYFANFSGNHSRYFDINPTNGQLRIRERIDRDGSGGLHVLEAITLTVVDAAGHETNKTFNVTIVDINDNPPFCGGALHKANVTENTTHGKIVQCL